MKVNFTLDWFQFTYLPDEDYLKQIYDGDLLSAFLCEYPEFEILMKDATLLVGKDGEHKQRNGYTTVYCYSDEFQIMWHDAHPRMGVHVIFPAHGLHRLCEIFDLPGTEEFCDVKALFERFNNRFINITRMDIAYDDYSKTFTPRDFNIFYVQERLSCRTKKFNYIASNGKDAGTAYFGSRGQERYLRVYDKSYESGGVIDAIRYELELRKGAAKQVIDFICQDKLFSFADILGDMITVKEEFNLTGNRKTQSDYRSKAKIDEKWEQFLGIISAQNNSSVVNSDDNSDVNPLYSPIQLLITRKIRYTSIQKKINWIEKYILPTLVAVRKAIGKDQFNFLCDEQERRLSQELESLTYKYREDLYNQIFKNIVKD